MAEPKPLLTEFGIHYRIGLRVVCIVVLNGGKMADSTGNIAMLLRFSAYRRYSLESLDGGGGQMPNEPQLRADIKEGNGPFKRFLDSIQK